MAQNATAVACIAGIAELPDASDETRERMQTPGAKENARKRKQTFLSALYEFNVL